MVGRRVFCKFTIGLQCTPEGNIFAHFSISYTHVEPHNNQEYELGLRVNTLENMFIKYGSNFQKTQTNSMSKYDKRPSVPPFDFLLNAFDKK